MFFVKNKFIKVLFVILALLFLFNTFSSIIVNLESDKCEKFESNLKPSSEENILYYDWIQTWKETYYSHCYTLTLDSLNNIYLGGSTHVVNGNDESCFIKYNSNGIQQFNVTWSGSGGNDECSAIAVDSLSNIYIAGFASSKIYLAKFNSTGNYEWHRTWDGGGIHTRFDYGIAFDSSNNIYVTGERVLIKFNTTGDEQWRLGVGAVNGVVIDASDDIYLVGFGGGDLWLKKYDNNGQQLWNRTWGGINDEFGSAITIDSLSNIYIAGSTESYGKGEYDMVLVKFDNSGTFQWYRTYGGGGDDFARTVSCDSLDNIYIGGELECESWKYSKIGIAKYSTSGEMKLNVTWGSEKYGQECTYRNKCYGIGFDSSNNIYIGGFVEGSHIFLIKSDSEFGIGKAKEVLFTDDIEFSKWFNTYLEKDPIQDFYSDKSHKVFTSFRITGYQNYFIIALYDKSITNNIKIITENTDNQNETIFAIQLYEEMNFSYDYSLLYSFYFNYTYTYEYCTNWDEIFCYESDYTSKSGEYLSDDYIITREGISKYSPSPFSSIPASLLWFLSVMMVGVLLEITYVQRKKRK